MYKNTVLPKSRQSWISIVLVLLVQSCAFSQQEKKEMVCVTKSGKKYHTESCSYLKDSSYRIEIRKAKQQGYTPCSVCKPGNGSNDADTVQSVQTILSPSKVTPVPENKSTSARQCSALTKTGMRCKRTTSDASGKCWQHQ
jgi:methylphosphotriester-DNA--protein-cysteine methyltransferase